MREFIASIVLIGLLTACGASGLTDGQLAPSPTTITVDADPYKPAIKFTSGPMKSGSVMDQDFWVLVAAKDRQTGNVIYYVQWGNVYDSADWRFYKYANAPGGGSLDFHEVSSNVASCGSGTCVHSEMYNIYIPSEAITNAADGISFKIYARDGTTKLVFIPEAVIGALKAKMASPG